MAEDEQDVPQPNLARIVAAASAMIGRPLTEPVVLQGGSGRSVVLRCREGGSSVIVKTYPRSGEGRSSFAAEAAGLELASGTGLAPSLLGADPDAPAVVMSDLGAGPSIADVLLGDSASAAESALL